MCELKQTEERAVIRDRLNPPKISIKSLTFYSVTTINKNK